MHIRNKTIFSHIFRAFKVRWRAFEACEANSELDSDAHQKVAPGNKNLGDKLLYPENLFFFLINRFLVAPWPCPLIEGHICTCNYDFFSREKFSHNCTLQWPSIQWFTCTRENRFWTSESRFTALWILQWKYEKALISLATNIFARV